MKKTIKKVKRAYEPLETLKERIYCRSLATMYPVNPDMSASGNILLQKEQMSQMAEQEQMASYNYDLYEMVCHLNNQELQLIDGKETLENFADNLDEQESVAKKMKKKVISHEDDISLLKKEVVRLRKSVKQQKADLKLMKKILRWLFVCLGIGCYDDDLHTIQKKTSKLVSQGRLARLKEIPATKQPEVIDVPFWEE